MNLSYGDVPNQTIGAIQQNPDFNTSMQHSVTLANMMDQRRQALAGVQRQANIRGIMGQEGAMDESGMYTPQTIQQVSAQEPQMGMDIQKHQADLAKAQAESEMWKAHGNLFNNDPRVQEVNRKFLESSMDNRALMAKQGLDSNTLADTNSGMAYLNYLSNLENGVKMPPQMAMATQLLNKYNTNPNAYDPQEVQGALNAMAAQTSTKLIGAEAKQTTAGAQTENAKTKEYQVSGQIDQGQQNVDEKVRHDKAIEVQAPLMANMRLQTGQTQTLTPEEQQALSNAIMVGGLDPAKVNSRTAKILADQELLTPGRRWNELSAQAGFERSSTTTNTKALLNSINPMLDQLDIAGKALGNIMVPGANKIVNWAKEATGQPEIVKFNNLRDGTVAEVLRGLTNTAVMSDSRFNREVNNIKSAQSYPQLRAAISATKAVIAARLGSIAVGPNPNANRLPGTARNSSANQSETQPQPGQLPTAQTVQAGVRPLNDVYADIAARIKNGKLDNAKKESAMKFLDSKGYKY